MMRILCVCLGNICRSPTAEAVLRFKAGAEISVDSAGTGNWHVGKPPYGPAIEAAALRGYDLRNLRARQVKPGDFEVFDLILAMDAQNQIDLEALRPSVNETPVRLMMEFTSSQQSEVPDPYFTGDFEEALDLIEAASDAILECLI
ncbi:MAG: low molecular weight phosphotyrosine protein phosphatase [Silicimonas sp.]|nr:low molecular weight phosphotyrosine protein phosphatase [Silicimonas sp.]